MADYEDQNSSEYKDINQETQAADQNPQNDGQIPPQNPGQNPYWQNQQNSGQFPPQNGQPPYWQNQYNNGQPPYWQNQPQRPRREKNSFATISLISGIFALLTLCCFAFPVAIICGVGAVCFAIISKKGQPSEAPQQPESSSALSPFFSASASSSMYSPSQT